MTQYVPETGSEGTEERPVTRPSLVQDRPWSSTPGDGSMTVHRIHRGRPNKPRRPEDGRRVSTEPGVHDLKPTGLEVWGRDLF